MTASGSQPSVALPWKAEGQWQETDFNNALAWLLQAEPLAAAAVAAEAEVDMSLRFPVKVSVRTGKARGNPDLTLDGANAAGKATRVILELKTRLDTQLTALQREGYADHFKSFKRKRRGFIVVAPAGYDARHEFPEGSVFLTHQQLRLTLESTLRDSLAQWLIHDMWTHFFGIRIDLDNVVLEPEHQGGGNTWSFLRRVLCAVNDRPSLRAAKVQGTRSGDGHWYGVNIKRDGSHVGWVGLCRLDGDLTILANTVSKKVLKAMAKSGQGRVTLWDAPATYRGRWIPSHLGRSMTPEQLLAGGLSQFLDALDAL